MPYDITAPDSNALEDTDIFEHPNGLYPNFTEAKKEQIQTAQTHILLLKQFIKEMRSSRKSDWQREPANVE